VVNYATLFKLFFKSRNKRTSEAGGERLRTVLLSLHQDMMKRGISHTSVSFIILLRALNDQKLYNEALALYSKYFESSHPPPFQLDPTIVDLTLKAARSANNMTVFNQLLEMMLKSHEQGSNTQLRPSVYTFNIAIDACKDNIEEAKKLLEKMLNPPYSLTPDLVTLNTLLAVCRNGKRPDVALSVCKNMFSRFRVQPDTLTFTILLQLKDDLAYFESVFEEMQKRKIALDHRLFNLVVAELVGNRQIERLEKFLNTVTDKFGLDPPVRELVEHAKFAPYIKQMLYEPKYLPHFSRKASEELYAASSTPPSK
jgi:pentatricopeptide repeat protein